MRFAFPGWQILLSVFGGLIVAWIVLIVVMALARPKAGRLQEALRLLPDVLRLITRLAADKSLAIGIRVRLGLLVAYLAFPIDLIPDFIPVIGYADDAILVCIVLRSVVRRAGPEALRRHWPGTANGLAVLWWAAGLPGSADQNSSGADPPAPAG
jgi:uncharacterized membrane protein YkvA (DUF1232 family)